MASRIDTIDGKGSVGSLVQDNVMGRVAYRDRSQLCQKNLRLPSFPRRRESSTQAWRKSGTIVEISNSESWIPACAGMTVSLLTLPLTLPEQRCARSRPTMPYFAVILAVR
jgi:hypothetical protein